MAFCPFKQVTSCERMPAPHVHLVDTVGTEQCRQPLFALERQAAILTGSSIKPVTLVEKMPEKKGTEKVSPQPAKATTKEQPNEAITTRAQESNPGSAAYRGVASLTWNYAVIFPSALRPHLPFKYINKTQRVKIQVDVVGDTVVLSKYVAPKK